MSINWIFCIYKEIYFFTRLHQQWQLHPSWYDFVNIFQKVNITVEIFVSRIHDCLWHLIRFFLLLLILLMENFFSKIFFSRYFLIKNHKGYLMIVEIQVFFICIHIFEENNNSHPQLSSSKRNCNRVKSCTYLFSQSNNECWCMTSSICIHNK